MPRKPLALIATAALATGALALAGCGSDDEGSDGPKDFTLVQEKPEITEADNGARGTTKGDQFHFEARMNDEDGEAAGIVLGELTVTGLPGRFGRPKGLQINRSELIFRLDGGDIMALGLSEYARAGWKLTADEPATRAIIGGTGDYAGARGELVTTRKSDGTYEQEFEFSD